MLLDQKNSAEAAASIAKIRSSAVTDLRAYPVFCLLDAWVCFEKVDFDQCLKLSEKLLNYDKDVAEKNDGRLKLIE